MLVVKINAIAIHPWGLSTKETTQIGLMEPAGKQSKLLAKKLQKFKPNNSMGKIKKEEENKPSFYEI